MDPNLKQPQGCFFLSPGLLRAAIAALLFAARRSRTLRTLAPSLQKVPCTRGARDGQGTKNILGGKETAALEYMEVRVPVVPGAQTGLRRPGNKKLRGWCR
jgi:hypothetical protein